MINEVPMERFPRAIKLLDEERAKLQSEFDEFNSMSQLDLDELPADFDIGELDEYIVELQRAIQILKATS